MMKKFGLLSILFAAVLNVCAQTKQTAADSLKFESAKKQLTTFFTAINTAGMDSILNGKPITILAPDDQAFAKLPAGMLDSLLKPANQQALIRLINNHILAIRLTAKAIAAFIHSESPQYVFTANSGEKLIAKINANRNIILTDENGNESIVKQFDITDGNAVIFIISSVILPK